MSLTKTVGFFAGTTLAIGGVAFGADQTNYASEIASLKAEIASLKSAQGDSWLTEQRAAEIRGIVTDVLADADTRSSLQGSGSGAGYDGGFFLSSADGNYSMKINLLQQIRWTYNSRDGQGANGENWGFENKRTRLTFSGNMVDSSWSYKVQYYFADATSPTSNRLSDAFVTKDFGNGFSMTVGQFKVPFSAESALDGGNLQFNEYSTISNQFANGRGQGLMLGYSADMFRGSVAYVNAINQTNTAFGSPSPTDEWAFAGRGEFKIAGNWDQFSSASSFKGSEFGAVVGVGLDAADSNTFGQDNTWGMTIDGTVAFGGANVSGAFFWSDNGNTTPALGENPWGFTIGGGVFVTDEVEIVARYEYGKTDTTIEDKFSAVTLGANWYLAKNTAKVGFNFGYSTERINAWSSAAAANNWLSDAANKDGQWLVQAQMSFSF